MAALLPRADQSAKVVAGGRRQARRWRSAGRSSRTARTGSPSSRPTPGCPVFDAKLDDLLPKPSKKVKDGIQSAELVLITSQEIDELCEADNIAQARLPDGRRARPPAAGRPGAGRPRHQDDRPRRRPRPPVRRRDRRGHEDRGPRRRDRRPAPPGLGRRGRHVRAVLPADLAGVARASTATSTSPPRGPSPASSRRAGPGPTSTAGCRPRS